MNYSVTIRKYDKADSKTKAFVTVKFEDCFVVNNIKIVEGLNGLFVSMPNYKGKDKDGKEEYKDIAHAVTKEFKEQLDKAILNEYNKA